MNEPTIHEDFLSRIGSPRGILPEGLVWDAERAQVSWVDIELGTLSVATMDQRALRLSAVLDLGDQLGCAVPAVGGGWVCGLGQRLATVSAQGLVDATPVLLENNERFNDGHADPSGRLVIGTLNSDGPDGRQLLLRVEPGGQVTVLDDAVGISNGIAWSPNGAVFYHADTADRMIWQRAYGDEPGPKQPFAPIAGMPDGIAVDSDGCVWVTVFDRGRIDCFTPDGQALPDRSIVLPDAHVASIAFGGPDLDILLIATGMPVMRGWQRLRRGQDGYVFTRSAPVRGSAVHAWQPAKLPTSLPKRRDQS